MTHIDRMRDLLPPLLRCTHCKHEEPLSEATVYGSNHYWCRKCDTYQGVTAAIINWITHYFERNPVNLTDVRKQAQTEAAERKLESTRASAESDPSGRSLNESGAKADAGKPRPALVFGGFSRALDAVVDVGTYGANKYTPHGWVTVPDGQARYLDAMLRHQQEVFREGALAVNHKDGDVYHLAQVAWNALAVLELAIRSQAAASAAQSSPQG